MNYAIIDANINRASEGLRVIEDFCRFISHDKESTDKLASVRKKLNLSEPHWEQNLLSRDTTKDMRAKEVPAKRKNNQDLLKANFKRIEEALRVLEEYSSDPIYNELRYDVYMLEKEILLTALQPTIKNGIYLISDDPKVLEQGVKWGVSLVQLRDKFASKETIYNKSLKAASIAKKHGTPFIVNDFLDIALLVNSDGLHTGQDDLPISEIRKILGPHKILGRTTHSLEQGKKAEEEGADYVSVGPIWETPSKPDRKGIGFDYLKKAKKELSIPYVAIGGINAENCSEIITHTPSLIGLIRDHENIPKIQKLLAL